MEPCPPSHWPCNCPDLSFFSDCHLKDCSRSHSPLAKRGNLWHIFGVDINLAAADGGQVLARKVTNPCPLHCNHRVPVVLKLLAHQRPTTHSEHVALRSFNMPKVFRQQRHLTTGQSTVQAWASSTSIMPVPAPVHHQDSSQNFPKG